MRSTLAMLLATIMVAAHAPDLLKSGSARSAPTRSGGTCCGARACCMHVRACQPQEACAAAAASTRSAVASGQRSQPQLCVGACADESPRMTPGAPDPGMLEPSFALPADFAPGAVSTLPPNDPSTRTPKPTDPPPRA